MTMYCVQQRQQPNTHAELLEYFLSTEMEEMQYELARCRPKVDSAFMQYVDTEIGMLLADCFAIAMFWQKHKKCILFGSASVTASANSLRQQ